MSSQEADLLRQQVVRSQKIATIKRNIEVLSNNVTRLQGQDSTEDLLPARARAIVVLNGKIAVLEAELHELELKQSIQKASLERQKREDNEDREQKPPVGKAPASETYLETDKRAGHENETIADSKPDSPKGKEALKEHCETSSEAKLARKKKMADLEAEVRVLSKIFERISAEMLELGKKGNGPKQTFQAGEIPATQIPLGVGAAYRPDDTAAKKRILKRLLLKPNRAEAMPSQVNKNADLIGTMHENELKERVKKMTGEGTKAMEKSQSIVQEKKPAGMVFASKATFKVESAASHPNEGAPGRVILDPLPPKVDNAQAIPTLISRDADLLAKKYEHELREKIKKIAANRIKAAEESKSDVQEEKPAGKVPTSEYLIPIAHEHKLKERIAKTTGWGTGVEEKIKSNVQKQQLASKVPTTEAPLEVENSASHTSSTSPEERILQSPHCDPDSAEAIPAQISKSEDHIAAIHEHELKGQVTKMTVEGINAAEKSESKVQEKVPTIKVPTTDSPLEVKAAASHSNDTAQDTGIPECPQRNPDSAEAIAARASQSAEILARIHQLALKRQIRKMTDAQKEAAERSKAGILKKIHAGKGLHQKGSLEVHAGPSGTHQTALKKEPLKQVQRPSVSAQALAAYESKIGDFKAQLHKYELKRQMEKVVDKGTKSAITKVVDAKPREVETEIIGPEITKTDGVKLVGTRSEGKVLGETKLEGSKSMGIIGKDLTQTPVGTALDLKTPMAPRKKKPEHLQPDSTKAQAIAAYESKIRNFKAILEKHELKQKIKKQRAEQSTKVLANRINDNEAKIAPGNTSSIETQLGAGKTMPHADKIRPTKRKAEEDPEVIPDSVKKQRSTPEPKVQEENPGKRKRIEAAKPKVEKLGRISATEYAEKTLRDAEPAPIRNDSAPKAPLETKKSAPHSNETCPKKRKAEEHETIPESKKQRHWPELKAREETPPKRKHNKTAEREIESPEYISIAEYDEQDEEETRSDAADQEKVKQENAEQANTGDEGVTEAPQRSAEVGPVRETQAAATRDFVPLMYVPDPFVDEVDYEID